MTNENIKKRCTIIGILLIIIGISLVIVGISRGASFPEHLNETVFFNYPSDGSAFNEIHRYYGDCSVFGEVSAICYEVGYATKEKSVATERVGKSHWILSQGQIDVCNMMFNKGTYDQFMGKDSKDTITIQSEIGGMCKQAVDNIDRKSFNKQYGKK